tara:strand:+ start:636 stop:830 length:195 start_codon:yes stop_codon:yes gene_type:complete
MNKKYINMQTIKHLKNNYIQLNKTIYRPYTICQLADTKFGQVDEDGYSLVGEWFNYKGFTYVAV